MFTLSVAALSVVGFAEASVSMAAAPPSPACTSARMRVHIKPREVAFRLHAHKRLLKTKCRTLGATAFAQHALCNPLYNSRRSWTYQGSPWQASNDSNLCVIPTATSRLFTKFNVHARETRK
eukprot:1145412-Pelagomonas_calceolata.AAC.2